MEALSEHTIAFSGLKDGSHAYDFMLGADFSVPAALRSTWMEKDP